MVYLQAVVKETLRMHPPGPLLSWAPLAIHDVTLAGHHVPVGTTAMVNMWSITHDPSIWSEPEKFNPERFLEQDIDVKGSDLRLAPFGAGRRVCPGRALGLATVLLWTARLVQQFEFQADSLHPVDLTERLHGIKLPNNRGKLCHRYVSTKGPFDTCACVRTSCKKHFTREYGGQIEASAEKINITQMICVQTFHDFEDEFSAAPAETPIPECNLQKRQ
ncbi:hypothetical protein SELMODRAFT_419267 [Selaginella moellendorffii]|uniref:Cytochrome P450-dependent monooxygenase n=1 Tax=Selaginella moellendorffii TaxID=88036 RepID=D8S8D5_SELML|nr:hypothetical protein SELMODRAFT_419267 [Selaginella moellendorffii]